MRSERRRSENLKSEITDGTPVNYCTLKGHSAMKALDLTARRGSLYHLPSGKKRLLIQRQTRDQSHSGMTLNQLSD